MAITRTTLAGSSRLARVPFRPFWAGSMAQRCVRPAIGPRRYRQMRYASSRSRHFCVAPAKGTPKRTVGMKRPRPPGAGLRQSPRSTAAQLMICHQARHMARRPRLQPLGTPLHVTQRASTAARSLSTAWIASTFTICCARAWPSTSLACTPTFSRPDKRTRAHPGLPISSPRTCHPSRRARYHGLPRSPGRHL